MACLLFLRQAGRAIGICGLIALVLLLDRFLQNKSRGCAGDGGWNLTQINIFLSFILGVLVALVMAFKWLFSRAIDAQADGDWLSDYKFAHRGLHNENVPENSLTAIKLAVEAGYAVEMDVQLTRDGHVVVFHDNELKRMAGLDVKVRDCDLAQLKKARLFGTEETIPTLDEVLELVDGRVPILFEMKSFNFSGRLESAFYEKIKGYTGRFAVQSFSPYSLRWFKKNAPGVLRGQLSCDLKHVNFEVPLFQLIPLKLIMFLIKRLETNFICKPNFISCEFHRINKKLLRKMREKGASILAWTIKSEEQFSHVNPFIDSVIFERFLPEKEPENDKKMIA